MDDAASAEAHDRLLAPGGDDDGLAGLEADFGGWRCERLPSGRLRAVKGSHRAEAGDVEALRRHIAEQENGRGLTAASGGVWSGIQK